MVVTTALLAIAPRAAAQEIPLTIDDAVARAVKESPRVAELRAHEEGARAAVESRVAAFKPQVTAQAGYTRTNHVNIFAVPQPSGRLLVVYPDIPDNYRTRLDVTWPVYTGGRDDALADAARAEADAAARDLATVEADLRFEATRAYWTAVTAAEAVRVVEQALVRIDTHLKDLRTRLEAGFIPPNEVLTAEAQRAREEVQVIEARRASELALADLRRLTNVAPEARVRLVTPLSAPEPAAETLEELIARARDARPERAALADRIEAAGARVRAAGSSARPTVAVGGGLDYARPNTRIFPRSSEWQDSWDVSVNASWSLWDSGRRAAEIDQASAAERAWRARLADLDSLIGLDVRQRRLDVDAGLAAARAAAEGVRSAAEARRVLDERFAVGVATSTDVLDAQVALLQAELDRTRALAGARIAEARLARALGR
jgi:outer membrane protein TolC